MAQSPTWPESPSENTHCEEVEEDQSEMVSVEDFRRGYLQGKYWEVCQQTLVLR